jgi:hypothetical protein
MAAAGRRGLLLLQLLLQLLLAAGTLHGRRVLEQQQLAQQRVVQAGQDMVDLRCAEKWDE